MIFGVPKEALRHEHRVGLTPYAVALLVQGGHEVFIERDAGSHSHFTDETYREAGASIAYSPEEVFGRADVVCRVGMLHADEIGMLKAGCTVCGFLHLAVMPRDLVEGMCEREITAIGYEIIERGMHRPILRALSEIAGQMIVHKAASLLEYEQGGRGVVLGAAPGIPPATVVVLGAGVAGTTAAQFAAANGAHVIVLDNDIERLRVCSERCRPREVVTLFASRRNIARSTAVADVLVGAVNVPGAPTPNLVTDEMVRAMKPGSVILDLSIDEGGCIETSRPTTPDNPTFQVHGVTHYCVPNLTSDVPRTASRALSLAAMPYIEELAVHGVTRALATHPGLARGTYLYRGRMVHRTAAEALDIPVEPLGTLLDASSAEE